VARKRSPQLDVTGPARRDIAAILRRSIREFGEAVSVRYRALILQALVDIEADPERPGSKERPEMMIKGARTYHLQFSRSRTSSPGVKDPRHFLLYRRRADGVIEVARVLDEAGTLPVIFLKTTLRVNRGVE
jgi:toxin ParE1/3/4